MKYPQGDADAKIRGDKRNLDYNVGVMQAIVLALDVAQAQLDLPFAGDFLHVDSSSTGSISIKFDTAMAAPFPMKTNTTIKDFPYRRVLVSWAAQAGKTVTLWYGYGVNIVPPNQDITTIGSITNPVTLSTWKGVNHQGEPGFLFNQDATAPGAGLFRFVQLWNPVGSGITVLLDRIKIRIEAATGVFTFRPSIAAIAALTGNGVNKNFGGTASKAEVRMDANAAPPGAGFEWMGGVGTGSTIEREYDDPVIITPGNGFLIVEGTANEGFQPSWEWREI